MPSSRPQSPATRGFFQFSKGAPRKAFFSFQVVVRPESAGVQGLSSESVTEESLEIPIQSKAQEEKLKKYRTEDYVPSPHYKREN